MSGPPRPCGPADHFFDEIAEFLGADYLRYSFTKGTEQEVAFLVERLGVRPGSRVLDVGCGPGRHALALAARGVDVVGVDRSPAFVRVAAGSARRQGLDGRAVFVLGDVRTLPLAGGFDVVLSLCQGGFGLVGRREDGAADVSVLAAMAERLRPGGRLVVSAFSAYFQVRHLEGGDRFDADLGVNHERTELRRSDGERREADLWTSCFTHRELRLATTLAGLVVEAVWSVAPGAYCEERPTVDSPEFLLVARRPSHES